MADPSREDIIRRDLARKAARQSLVSEVEQAKHNLHPRTLTDRWKSKQMVRLESAAASARQNVAKNAPLIGFAAAAGLLFAARKPISNWIDRLRDRKPNVEGDE